MSARGRNRNAGSTAVMLLLMFFFAVHLPAQEEPASRGEEIEMNEDLAGRMDRELDKDIAELRAIAHGDDGDDVGRELLLRDDEGQLDASQVTSSENPLISDECEDRAMRRALETMMEHKDMDAESAKKMARMHTQEQNEAARKDNATYLEYVEHVAECKAFCGPLVKDIIACHVAAVKSLEHGVAFFDLDSHELSQSRSRQTVERITDILSNRPGSRVLLIGRASRIGPLGYNRRLSGRRAAAVAESFREGGIAASRIKILRFGWEPPQITAAIAQAYGISDSYLREDNRQVNQSVIIVVY